MSINQRQKITWQSSLFLDCLRLLSALIVLYVHAHDQWFPLKTHAAKNPGNIAHSAVVVFFVLSGYVISHTTTANNRGKTKYLVARLSRLYSVVFPALLITAFIEFIVKYINPLISGQYSRGLSWPRYIISGFFLNEIWSLSAAPPINIPLWSLSFEFWYYAIFGLWFYRGTGRKSLILPITACFIAGPKILLMMPIWLLGFVAYRVPRPSFSAAKGWVSFLVTVVIVIVLVNYLPPLPFNIGVKPYYFANQFITDWIIGIFIATTLWLLPFENTMMEKPNWIGKFRKIADLTFPIYVLHHPLLVLWRSIISEQANQTIDMWQAITIVLLTSAVIGIILEAQRQKWVNFFNLVMQLIKRKTKKVQVIVNTLPGML